jgi:type II secretory ATPase GspE/PulE/Tfp pilus assembly ATPase PilB-like protein
MKSILRQDPDIIMIGEIRDQETAEHAVRASLVGRIIFSTIHSNTTIGTIARLLDMNIERSMIAYALSGVISTRLVRKNCPSCLEEYTPDDQYLSFFGVIPGTAVFRRGRGCDACKGTGHEGRIGIFEFLAFENTLRAMIIDKASMASLENYALETGMKTLKQDALEKALAGIITLENAARAV